ncbi:Uncharacterised protein [Legionella oakridgensis]|nr:Uncharacterised protein [Legionella oakridgensis]
MKKSTIDSDRLDATNMSRHVGIGDELSTRLNIDFN